MQEQRSELALGAEAANFDDLGDAEVTVETLLGGGAERAVQRATDLRGNAQRATIRFGDEHRFDAVAAIQPDQPLVGAVAGSLVERDRRWADLGSLGQPFPQRLAQVGHGGEIGDAFVVNPLHDLGGAEGFLAHFDEKAFQIAAVQIE